MSATKTCPYCAEVIKLDVLKCPFCCEDVFEHPAMHPGNSKTPVPPPLESERLPVIDNYEQMPPRTPFPNIPDPNTDHIKDLLHPQYDILHEIGRGGMATVYRAIQKSLNRSVAIKIVYPNLAHKKEFIELFHQEARYCAALNQANIVKIFDVDNVSGLHFIVMEYLEGTDLFNLIRNNGKFSQEQTLKYTIPIAKALDYAHGLGYVHRDIKSANIFVTHNGRVVLMDFGIAHAAYASNAANPENIIGTPEYMSPEQVEGKTVDHRADLYSLGIVMYECLTGQVPFKTEHFISTLYKIIYEEPPHPGLQHVSKPIKECILKLLSKQPENRFASAGDLIRYIEQLQQIRAPQPYYIKKKQSKKTSEEKPPEHTIKFTKELQAKQPEKPVSTSKLKTKITLKKDKVKLKSKDLLSEKQAVDKLGLDMVFVEGGTFTMGCTVEQNPYSLENEKPAHEVALNDFYIGKYPVSFRQWFEVLGYYPVKKGILGKGQKKEPAGTGEYADHPVVNVSWHDIQKFIRKLNHTTGNRFRLPSEAEWEYAARGGNKSTGFVYSGSQLVNDVAWYDENSTGRSHKVGDKAPNELGIYDMSGNVWEWCMDRYELYTSENKTNLSKSSRMDQRILRGGAWNSPSLCCRVSHRIKGNPSKSNNNTGFRLVQVLSR